MAFVIEYLQGEDSKKQDTPMNDNDVNTIIEVPVFSSVSRMSPKCCHASADPERGQSEVLSEKKAA